MNPRSTLALPKSKALFAAEVYREEESARRPEPRDEVGAELARLRAEMRGEARALRTALARPAKVPAELLAEIASLRAMVDELVNTPKKGDVIATMLRARGIEGSSAAAFARIAKKSTGSAGEKLRAAANELVKTTAWPPAMFGTGKSIVALVGPAGVGKTTTAAKLAARAKMAKKTVALVSCDGFRVGAMDQLSKYAELLEASFHTATTAEELLDVLAAETADVIIIDTSGRAIETDATEALIGNADLRNGRDVEVLLCIPASLRAADAVRAHRDFAIARPTAICVTKLDETDAPSGIAHAAFATRLPVSTLCYGQNVPEDIAPATDEAVASYLFANEVSAAQ